MSAAEGPSSVDALWEALAPHVEWPEGFSLVFLFAGHPGPVGELRGRLERSVRARGKGLMVLEPASAEEVVGLTPMIVRKPEEGCGALWVSLLRQAGTSTWDGAMRELLYRLNERRFLLERDLAVPMVMVLPLEMRLKVYGIAPDLWTVRSFVGEVPAAEQVPALEQAQGMSAPASMARGTAVSGLETKRTRTVMSPAPTLPQSSTASVPGRAELEWARLLATGRLPLLATADGVAAHESAMERGDLGAARRIAMETLAVVLSRAKVEVERVSDFDVLEALAKVDTRDARSQRELSIALDRLAEVELHADDLSAARSLMQRSLELCEALAQADPASARARRDLSVSSSCLGHVELQAGNLAAARSLFARALVLREALAEANPHDPQAQRDLSISLHRLGDLELRAGDLEAARSLFQRGLDLSMASSKADPHSAEAQRDLSVSSNRLGYVELQAGNLAAARSLFERCLDLAEALAKADPHRAQASFDLAEAHDNLARLGERAGDRQSARDHLRHATDILAAMDARGQLAGFATREQLRDDITRRLEALTQTPP